MSKQASGRDVLARRAALEVYARAHDRFADQEQILMHEGREVEAAGCAEFARRIQRAWRAEIDDPVPA